ncbi:PfkB family carbohydrate kinase [Cellulomonas sp. URHD0024]|uniref:PfkB family carbohydrate kinase n=1 Tax=Cellulomonas sp. URHD0024 TaxID=1302620 RepID=UPI00041AB057|nr:PfkB family carbohydrate kinase [Cellulomonas sp. URHD0024]
MSSAAHLVCCGLATLDVVQVVDHVPGPNEKLVAQDLTVTFGGPAANAAATAVALGVPTTLVTALGAGSVGELVRARLVAAGIEVVDLLDGVLGSPAVSTVLVTRSSGERAVVSVNATGTADLQEAARSVAHVLDDATALLVDGHHRAAAAVLAAGAAVPVLLDGGSWKPGLERLLAHVDHAVLSADFAVPGTLDGDVLDVVAAFGPRTVARSAGAGPVQIRLSGSPVVRSEVLPPVVPVGDVVDTLGAGDVLHGAIAAALAREVDILEAIRDGVQQASESVRHRGALGWVGH